jgi:hypothetical protein
VLTLAGMGIIGGLSVLTFSKAFGTIFLGQPRTTFSHKPHEVSLLMLLPQYLIVLVMLSIAFVPQVYINTVGVIMQSIHPLQSVSGSFTNFAATTAHINLYFILLTIIVASFWFLRYLVMKKRDIRIKTTWGCGYIAPNSRQQYTGKSFSKPLSKIFNVLLIERKQFEELEKGEIFPATKSYISHYQEFIEKRLIAPITDLLILSTNYFSFIQNGRIQSYVLYGIVFILAMVLLSIFNVVA